MQPPQTTTMPASIDGNRFRFTLRTMFAVMWLLACVIAATLSSIWTLLFIGLPFGLIGFAMIGGRSWRSRSFVLLGALGCFGLFGEYVWPRIICPIPLPSSASRVQVSVSWSSDYVRFEAPAEDCIEHAEYVMKKFAGNNKMESPEKIDRIDSPNHSTFSSTPSWFDIHSIQRGWKYHYTNYYFWIDTDKGVLYYSVSD